MQSAMTKSVVRDIKNSLGRFISIAAIIALGVSLFSGLKVSQRTMINTADEYFEKYNFYDYKIVSTLRFDEESVYDFVKNDSIIEAEGAYSTDICVLTEDGADAVVKAHTITDNVNKLELVSGRLPTNEYECVIDSRAESSFGKTLLLSDDNDKSTFDVFKTKEYIITGVVHSPEYISYERGTTSLGNGSVKGFVYFPVNAVNIDYYTEIYVDTELDYTAFSDEYDEYCEKEITEIEYIADLSANGRYNRVVDEATVQYNEGISEYNKGLKEYNESKKLAEEQLKAAQQELDDAQKQITENEALIAENEKKLNDTSDQYKEYSKQLKSFDKQIEDAESKLNELEEKLASLEYEGEAKSELQKMIESAKTTVTTLKVAKSALVNSADSTIQSSYAELEKGKKELETAKEQLSEGKKEFVEAKADSEKQLNAAKEELDKAKSELEKVKKEIDSVKEPTCYVLTRNENMGCSSFESNASIVDGIGNVFPVLFFLVAVLVCITTMTRMIDDQRTQIGVMKALGYSSGKIMAKYMMYSGLAAMIGCLIGYFVGITLFPYIIWEVYDILYGFAELSFVFDVKLFIISVAVSFMCSAGITALTCFKEFTSTAASLMRPKAPTNGKRILLEYVKPLWKHLKFLHKVSIRNIFRYKKRMFMMILGISGCTALVVTGFGLKDSIQNITVLSFILSVVLTLAFSLIVCFVMYFKLEKIDMAQSLKSIE